MTTIIKDDFLAKNLIIIFTILLIIFIIHISICIYLYLTQKKHPELNGMLWFILNLLLPPFGLIGYIINKLFLKLHSTDKANTL